MFSSQDASDLFFLELTLYETVDQTTRGEPDQFAHLRRKWLFVEGMAAVFMAGHRKPSLVDLAALHPIGLAVGLSSSCADFSANFQRSGGCEATIEAAAGGVSAA